MTTITSSAKKALVFGASGLVGSNVLSQLMDHPAYDSILGFYRSGQDMEMGKLQKKVVDFEQMHTWMDDIQGNDLFICLGTTIAKAGSKKAFYHMEFDYITQIATIAQEQGVGQLMLVSSMGADARSMIFYNQVKGLIEDQVKKLNFWAVHILRPSILLGQRDEQRTMESIAAGAGLALRAIGPKLFSKITPIEGHKVARCMIQVAQETRSGVFYYPSDVIAKLGRSAT